MKYRGQPHFDHQQKPKVAVLITNLGTPDAPTQKALRRYLSEFLSDPRVVEVPRLLWQCILHGVILRIRPQRSAKAYQSVWQKEGSPLLIYTHQQAKGLQDKLRSIYGEHVIVDFAMRYGSPAIADVIDNLLQSGARKLIVLPLYPQYSAATTASTFDAIANDFTSRRWLPDFRFLSHYHDHPTYIDTLAKRIQQHWVTHGKADKLLFSYHGIPLRYLKNGDPYHCECHKTSRLIAEQLQLDKTEYMTTFQSRFGREEWLKPYTDETLKHLASTGTQSVQVICPGFAADCLETIEEIDEENREYFINAGGQRYEYIPALNAEADHIDLLATLVDQELSDWVLPAENAGQITQQHYTEHRKKQQEEGQG